MPLDASPTQSRFIDEDVRRAAACLRAKIGNPAVAMVAATAVRGPAAGRPLLTQQLDDDGVLWFFVGSDGALARGVQMDPRVCACYSDTLHGVYVAMSGHARLVYDPDRIFALWDDRVEAWFPEGPLDARLALLRVEIDHAEYWDEHSNGSTRFRALAHAALLREPPPSATEHRRLILRNGNTSPA
jgi:general stress protein 26